MMILSEREILAVWLAVETEDSKASSRVLF